MAINTIIFDFDGTVANTNQVVFDSWQHTYKKYRGKIHPVKEIVKTFGEPLWISMERAFPGEDISEAIETYREYQRLHFKESITLFDGMYELISELKKKAYNIGIVTSRTRDTTLTGLEKFNLDKYVDNIVSCDDTNKHKPDPEPVLIALKNFGISEKEAIMVGDSMFDILCAKNAGVKSVLVDWAIAVTEEDKNGPNKPEYIIKEANDLFEII